MLEGDKCWGKVEQTKGDQKCHDWASGSKQDSRGWPRCHGDGKEVME